jgi:hypothetical protein
MPRTRRTLALGLTTAVLAPVASASARTEVVVRGELPAGESWLRVAYVPQGVNAFGQSRGARALDLVGPDRAVRRLVRFPPPEDEFADVALWPAATADRLAWIKRTEGPDGEEAELFAGPLLGPYHGLTRCVGPPPGVLPRVDRPAVDGPVVAMADCEGRIHVHHEQRGGRTVDPRGSLGLLPELAVGGRHVAWNYSPPPPAGQSESEAPDHAALYDVDAGAVVADVALPDAAPGSIVRLDAQPDGATAALWTAETSERCASQAAWFRPGDTAARPLPAVGCGGGEIRISEGIVAYVRDRVGGGDELTTIALDGRRVGPVTNATKDVRLVDFAGRRIVWSERTCTGFATFAADVLTEVAPPPPACPVQVGGGTPHTTRAGLVRVPVACPNGCAGSITARVPRGQRAPTGFLNVRPGGRTTVGVRLTRAQRRQLARRRRLRVTFTLSTAFVTTTFSRTLRAR